MRFSASFGSSNSIFVGGCSSEEPFEFSRVIGDSLVGGALEGPSLTSRITLRFSKVGWSSEGLSKVGGTLEGVSPSGGHAVIMVGAY